MSLFNFLRWNKQWEREHAVKTRSGGVLVDTGENGSIACGEVEKESAPKLSLDEIREALQKIAEIIGDDEEVEHNHHVEAGHHVEVKMTIGQVAELAPFIFRNVRDVESSTEPVKVIVNDPHEQFATGRVVTTIGRLACNVREDLLIPEFEKYYDRDVCLPLQLVMSLVPQDEEMPSSFSWPPTNGTEPAYSGLHATNSP